MSRILTVDDSRAIRAIVAKQVAEMGHELAEAEDGEQGLQRLAEGRYDLVLLDVTMPVLDGPGMLRRMRDRGDRTPVLMLTSESKRAIIAECMRLGIEDYILKPFKPEELHAKIAKILPGGAGAQPGPAAAAAAPEPGAGKAAVDFLLVDDMENVAKKLRSLLPAHVTLDTATGGPAALQMCRERTYRMILVDTDIPDTNSAALMGQLRLLQSQCAFLALSLRSVQDAERIARADGFDGLVCKPFHAGELEDLLIKHFDNQEILRAEDNLLRAGPCPNKPDRLERYFRRMTQMLGPALARVASACYDDVILDMSDMPLRPDCTPHLVSDLINLAGGHGLRLL
ncbi:MAG TPA: response regulator, partial [Haliangiales bacterium]|nr:response regulator [Haliangiales bacterium]